MRRPTRYGWSAPFYDVLSAEWPVYRAGRKRGIRGLRLQPGDRVLDLGCGTGLNFPLILNAIGPSGRIVGVDASASMLAQAARRARRAGWANVALLTADATTAEPVQIRRLLGARAGLAGGADAVLFIYSLSLMHPWASAWERACQSARPGGRAAVVDMMIPVGPGRIFSPLARLACALGGADIHAHPWTALEEDTDQVTREQVRAGHIQIRAGTLRPGSR